MILKVENLGHLKEAEIDLSKDLIVLCGTNNSGKTYMAYSVFGLYKFANLEESLVLLNENISFDDGFEDVFEYGNIEIDVISFYKANNRDLLNTLSSGFDDYLPSLFAAVNTSLFSYARFNFLNIDDNEKLFLNIEIAKQLNFGKNISVILKKSLNDRFLLISVITKGNKEKIDKKTISTAIQFEILTIFYKIIFNNVYIAPAERASINIFSKELAIKRNNLVDELLGLKEKQNRNPLDLLLRRTTRYPLAIRETLEIAEDLKNLRSNKSEYDYFADSIEKEILGGKIQIGIDGDIDFTPNAKIRKGSAPLGIHLTGSMVKSLSSLVFYFRHLAQKNDFIIIDEPELNLHPDNQRKVAKLIVRFINAGFKVMISTHSDFIIRELNILMMLNSTDNKTVADKLVRQYKYAQDELLDYNKVGAYFFDNNRNTVIEVTDTGFEVSTIDKEALQQNEAAQDIFLKLYNE